VRTSAPSLPVTPCRICAPATPWYNDAGPRPRERRQPGMARERTVYQERYNPLKVGDQPQEAWAKVRQDFGVRLVT
jgi:hypothetical protein